MSGVPVPDLYQEDAEAAESALDRVLEAAVEVGRSRPLSAEAAQLVPELLARQARAVVPLVVHAPDQARRHWEYLRAQGWAGHAAEVHAARDAFRHAVERKLRLAEQGRRVAETFLLLTAQALPEASPLAEAEEALRRLHAEIFGRWDTLEDLEDLLAASFPLSGQRLAAIAEKHPPPPEWYEEEDKPF